MDKRKSLLNVSVSISFKIITLIVVIIVKRFLIKYCGNEINGLNSLYFGIIGLLSVTEFGIGSAITFCMYKPIVEGDNNTVSALYHLFRRIYPTVGGIILLGGLVITPYIKVFAKDYQQLDVDFKLTFLLMLISVIATYLFSCKTALINAYKNNYITTAISSGGILLQYILQIVVLILTHSFTAYIVCRIVVVALQWLATEIVARKKYSPIIKNNQKLTPPVKTEVSKNIKAMFMHNLGYILVNSVDSVVISTFVGVSALGLYSNYLVIMTSMTEVVKLVFTSLTSVVGHLYVEANKETTEKYLERFHLLNFVLGCVFFLGYYAVIDNLISVLFSDELVISKSISFVITLNGFVQFMRQSVLLFRDATGTFYNDRWKSPLEGIINLVLSIILVRYIEIIGVLAATIVTNLLICHVIEPYMLYKKALNSTPKNYYVKNYTMILLFVVSLIVYNMCSKAFDSLGKELLVNGLISVGISAVVCIIVLYCHRNLTKGLLSELKK